jgi:hypothetical protein
MGVALSVDQTTRLHQAADRAEAAIKATQEKPDNLIWDLLDKNQDRVRLQAGFTGVRGLGFRMTQGIWQQVAQATGQGGAAAAATDVLAYDLQRAGLTPGQPGHENEISEESRRTAREWMGLGGGGGSTAELARQIAGATGDLNAAAANLKDASETLKKTADDAGKKAVPPLPDLNAHTE